MPNVLRERKIQTKGSKGNLLCCACAQTLEGGNGVRRPLDLITALLGQERVRMKTSAGHISSRKVKAHSQATGAVKPLSDIASYCLATSNYSTVMGCDLSQYRIASSFSSGFNWLKNCLKTDLCSFIFMSTGKL